MPLGHLKKSIHNTYVKHRKLFFVFFHLVVGVLHLQFYVYVCIEIMQSCKKINKQKKKFFLARNETMNSFNLYIHKLYICYVLNAIYNNMRINIKCN